MKRYQKVLALLLISLMALSLSGCSLITITKTASNMSSLKSVSADLALNLGMDMTMMDETSPFEIAVSGPFDFDLANGKGKSDLTLDLMGENVDLLLYYERLEDKFVIYTSADNGETWTRNETPLSAQQEKDSSDLKSLAMIKKLFSDPNTTNAEVRAAAREAVAMLEREQEEVDRVLGRELAATEMAAGLVECSVLMDVSPPAYISEGKKTYGTSISEDGTSTTTGVLGTAVMVIIGLLTVVYTLFSGIHVMRGSANAESLLSKLLLFIVIAIVIILAIQSYI